MRYPVRLSGTPIREIRRIVSVRVVQRKFSPTICTQSCQHHHHPRHIPSVKMASNLAEFFRERFIEATGKWNTDDKHNESLEEFSLLLMEPRLPLLYRLKANLAIAIGHDDWVVAEDFRHDAEKVYGQIRMLEDHPVGDERFPEIERELVAIRERLDTLAKDQITDDPGTEDEDEDEAQADTSDHVGDSHELSGDSQELQVISQEVPADSQELHAASQALHSSSQELPGGSQELLDAQESSQASKGGSSIFTSGDAHFNSEGTTASVPMRPHERTPDRLRSDPVGRLGELSARRKRLSPEKEDSPAFTGSPTKKKKDREAE
jgi:hypothetical protein